MSKECDGIPIFDHLLWFKYFQKIKYQQENVSRKYNSILEYLFYYF